MPKDLVYKSYTVKLKPLTPIHVWSGKKLVYGLDIVRQDDRACIVDFDKLPQDIVDKLLEVKAENMVNALESFAPNVPCSEYVKFTKHPSSGTQINELAKQVIPGSSLKGYIRTAIMYTKLKGLGSPNNIRNVLHKVLSRSVNLLNKKVKPKNVAQDLEYYFFRAHRPKKQGGFVDSFQQLIVSDPEVSIDRDCLSIEEFEVYELPAMSKIASQYVIAVLCGELIYNIKVFSSPTDPANINPLVNEHTQVLVKLSLLQKNNILFESLKIFGCELLRYEIDRVKNIKNLEKYRDFLEDLVKKYCEQQTNCVVGRIGYMTGLRSKTVIGIVKNVDYRLYKKISKKMSQKLKHTWDERTIKLVNLGGNLVGIGWCEICLNS
ncbi:MAG: type III-A CRISPR-associated RAMP protein Csm5 [Ignisphaera sp.]